MSNIKGFLSRKELVRKPLPHIFLSSLEALILQASHLCPLWALPEWGLSPSYYNDGLGKCPSACCHQSKPPVSQTANSVWGMSNVKVVVVTSWSRKKSSTPIRIGQKLHKHLKTSVNTITNIQPAPFGLWGTRFAVRSDTTHLQVEERQGLSLFSFLKKSESVCLSWRPPLAVKNR